MCIRDRDEVGRVGGAALGFLFGGGADLVAVVHEEVDGLFHGHVAGVHADADDVAGVAEERILDVYKRQLQNPLRRSAPVSTGPPSAPPGLAPSVSPRAVTCRFPSRCIRASLPAVGRSWRSAISESRPEILSRPFPTSQSLRSIGHPPPALPCWLAPFSSPPPAYPADRAGRITHKTGISAPASPSDVVSVSAKRVSPAAARRFPRPPTPSLP